MKRAFIILILSAAAGLLAIKGYQMATAPPADFSNVHSKAPVAVAVVPVETGSIVDIGRFSGSLHALSQFKVAPKIAGRLKRLYVNIGDTVQSGQLIAVLDDAEYRQAFNQAKAELDVARATLQERKNVLENARREYDRTLALREKKIASESQLDAAVSELNTQEAKTKVAIAQVAQKTAALETARVRLSYAQIRMPENSDGGFRVVGERFVDEGALLAPNSPVVSIYEIGRLTAVIHVIERDYPKIMPGLKAVVRTDAYPGRTFAGRVLRAAPVLKEASREARVEVEVVNDGQLLKPGMFVRIRIRFAEHTDATLVPVEALVNRGGRQGVFLADTLAGTARFVPLTLGIVDRRRVQVLAPALEGEVVTLGQHLLSDGAPILITRREGFAGKGAAGALEPNPLSSPAAAADDS